MADRLQLRNDTYVHLHDFNQEVADPEEINRLLDRAAMEFQNATKLLRRRQPVRIESGLGSLAPRGSVIRVTMTVGSAYNDTTTITFATAPSGGTRATGVPVIDNGAVRDVIVTHPGEGYTTAPAITVTGGAGTGASGTTAIDGPAGQGFSGDILWVENSSNQRMTRVSEAKMDVLFGASWKATATGTASRWLHGKEGANILRIYPAIANSYVYVTYAGIPAALADDDAQPEFDPAYHDALPWWVAYRLLCVAGAPQEKITAAQSRWMEFIEGAKLQVAKMDAG